MCLQGTSHVAQLVESCQRNCLLAMSLAYMPMPGMPTHHSLATGCCCACAAGAGFAGVSKALIARHSCSSSARGSATDRTPNRPQLYQAFSLSDVLHEDPLAAIFDHQYNAEEACLAVRTIDLLHSASLCADPPDFDMVRALLRREVLIYFVRVQSCVSLDSRCCTSGPCLTGCAPS